MAQSYKIRGIAPPDLQSYPSDVRKQFWAWVVEFGIRAKVKDLKAGLDKDGKPLKPISAKTAKYRRSAMTPRGKGDPKAPPLIPGHTKSRTISLLNGRAFATHAEFFWRFDAFTGDSWGAILEIQAQHGRDAVGLSPAATARVKVRAWDRWAKWKQGRYPAHAAGAPVKAGVPVPQVGSYSTEHATFGIGAAGPEKFASGQWTGGMTWPEWQRYMRETARAKIPGRPNPRKSPHPDVGPGFNRLLGHVWAAGGPGGQSGGAKAGRPRAKPPGPGKQVAAMKSKPAAPAVPVSAALDASGHPIASRLDRASGLIAMVHDTGRAGLARIPVEEELQPHIREGGFWRAKHPGATDYHAEKITVHSTGTTPELTYLHEIGHFLERFGIPGHAAGNRTYGADPATDGVFAAIRASGAYKDLVALKAYTAVDKAYVEYLLRDPELFARAYAQYIARRSKDPTLADQLNSIRNATGNAYNVRQWANADFAPIARAMDELFRSIGWMT